MRDRSPETQRHVQAILDDLRTATDRRDKATATYQAECIEWEDAVRRAYRLAQRVSAKELAPTVAEMAQVLGISEKSLQNMRHRAAGTAAWPRPT